jgi:hypothetical protein
MTLVEKETKGKCEANWLSWAKRVRRVSGGEGRASKTIFKVVVFCYLSQVPPYI